MSRFNTGLVLLRAIMLKGANFGEMAPKLWPMALFFWGGGGIALKRYRQTLD